MLIDENNSITTRKILINYVLKKTTIGSIFKKYKIFILILFYFIFLII